MSELKLTSGSRYRVRSWISQEETVVNEGTFKGILTVGSVDTLILEVEEDGETLTRLVPTHVIVQLDVLEVAGQEEVDDEGHIHYG